MAESDPQEEPEPATQNGSWHGLQLLGLRDFDPSYAHMAISSMSGLRGLFVEQSPTSRAIFELERIASSPKARPHWWAIRISPETELRSLPPSDVAERFRQLGVENILARHEVSPAVRKLSIEPPRYLGEGYVLYTLPDTALAYDEQSGEALDSAEHLGTAIELELEKPGAALISSAYSSDWRIEEGEGTLSRTAEGLIRVEGHGYLKLAYRPRAEEWLGLVIGIATWLGLAVRGALTLRRRRAVR